MKLRLGLPEKSHDEYFSSVFKLNTSEKELLKLEVKLVALPQLPTNAAASRQTDGER